MTPVFICLLFAAVLAEYDLSELQIAVSTTSSCLAQYGQVGCWGQNLMGQLGRGDTDDLGDDANELGITLAPIDLGEGFVVKQIAGGGKYHFCAVSVDFRLKCWGDNTYGQLGYGDTNHRGDAPGEMGANLVDVDLGEGFLVEYVDLGEYHTCAFSVNQEVKCFGRGINGRLGTQIPPGQTNLGDGPNEMGENLLSLDFPGTFVPSQLSVGFETSCAVSVDFALACWGYGAYGLMGQGNAYDVYQPTLVDLGNFDVEFVSSGRYGMSAVSTNGDLKCWGKNGQGQLGYAHNDDIGDDAGEMGDNLGIVDLGRLKSVE